LDKDGKTETPSPRSQDLIQQRIIPSLEKLQADEDVDVRYFATTAPGGQDEVMQTSP
jgi:serine/threonine-protein phosphatase 2A regulatory subunit A